MTTILRRRSAATHARTAAVDSVAALALAVAGCGGSSGGAGAGAYGGSSEAPVAAGSGGASVALARHPRFTYAGDSAPGQVSERGSDAFGAEWYALSAAGTQIEIRG